MVQLGHAIVIGGSIAGLITARVLSDYFECVTILERDEIEDRPAIRKSVPQGNHLHGLLNGDQRVLSALYLGFTDDLRRLGARRITVGRDIAWYLPDGKAYNATGSLREPFDVGLEGHCASRGLIEYVIRRRTRELPGIRFETGTTVRELICREGRVHGVRCEDGRSFEAEIVVDATGRASRAPQWLAAVGVSEPRQTTIGVDTAYSTANFRVPEWYDGESLVEAAPFGSVMYSIEECIVEMTAAYRELLASRTARSTILLPTSPDGYASSAMIVSSSSTTPPPGRTRV